MNTLNRRSFMRAAGGGAASMAASGLTVGCRAEQRQPNILITIADDQTYLDTGCYGSRQARTPNIDRLAGEGVRFTHAFTGTAMCAPMRQQFYTGIFPVRNGAYPNHSQIKPGIKTLPDYLQALGYRVGLAGKRHFGPVESYSFEWVGSQKELDFQAIREFTTRDPAQPYCILVCSHEPHGPHDKGDQSKYPPEQLTVPPYMVDTPETRQALCAYLAEVEYFDGEVGNCMEIVRDSGQEDNTLFLYCSEQGSGFPGSKWTCYDRGLQEAFVVRWPGRVQPGSVANAMIQGVDALPTLIEAAGGDAPAGLDGHSYLDVLEGKSDIHNTEVYGVHTTRGIIMGSECYPVRSIRTETHKLILNLNSEIEFRNVITTGQGYWRSWVEKAKTDPEAARLVDRHLRRPEVEFYDIVNDLLEMSNLAGEAEHQPAITSMKRKLHAWMEQQGDSGVETEMLVTPHKRS